jgi:hypothetical protein
LLFPNPAETVLFFSKQVDNVVIMDAAGRQLNSYANVAAVNVGQLAGGAYQLIISINGKRRYLSFIKK